MDDFIYFGSGMNREMSKLSNFCACEFDFMEHRWPSSEHAFQAILKVDPSDWGRFSVGGDLSVLGEDKVKYWGAKKNGKLAMVGIVAKMAVKNPEKLNLKIVVKSPFKFDELFLRILMAKYTQCEDQRSVLLGTGNKQLIEFSRSAKRESLKGKSPFWAGLVDKETGVMYGQNMQGELHMAVRRRLSR